MNNRERIRALVQGKPVDRQPFTFYFGPWPEAIERWKREGLEGDWQEVFGMDAGIETVQVNLGYLPAFEYKVLEERADTRVIVDRQGVTQLVRKQGASIPHYLDYPVKSAQDWTRLKARLDPDSPGRFPENWPELVKFYNQTDRAVQLGCYPYGLFGTLRDMMGVEALLINFIEESGLIHRMMDYLTDFWLAIFEKVVRQVKVDIIHIWEDMSGKTGSMISPRMVREFMLPNYKKITDFARAHDIAVVSVDTDGDCGELIPLFKEAGINMMMPFEVQAGCDVNDYQRRYPELTIMGGFNKQALWKDEAAIDAEFERLAPMFRPGVRYICTPDHLIPPEVPYPLFCYFMERLARKIGVEH